MKIKVKHSGVVKLGAHKDRRRGHLFVAEVARHIPFSIKRVYFMNNFRNARDVRGGHAHKKTPQAIFCASGSFVLNLDDGKRKQTVLLNNPTEGVILGPKLWHTMSDFSKDCVILVLAGAHYKENDYIRNYDEFMRVA